MVYRWLILVILLLTNFTAYTQAIVGLIGKHSDKLEEICKIFHELNAITVLIDCNGLNSAKIEQKLRKLIEKKIINRVFIVDSPSIHCEAAIRSVIHDNPSIYLLGLPLRNIFNSEIIHTLHHEFLQQIKIVPNSYLAGILSKFLIHDVHGWLSIYLPTTCTETIKNDPQNRKRLELLGYKIVGFSNTGLIEIVEDKYGNLYFRSHAVPFMIKPNFTLQQNLIAISIIYDFLNKE